MEFILYVAGRTLRSRETVRNVRDILADVFGERHSFRVVDVLEDPLLTEDAKILATPTLIRAAPPPERRIIGDLSDREKVLLGLGLDEPS